MLLYFFLTFLFNSRLLQCALFIYLIIINLNLLYRRSFFVYCAFNPFALYLKNIRFKFDETSVLHILNLNTTLGVHIAHIEVPSLRE